VLFVIVINDLDKRLEIQILEFADDAKVFRELSEVENCQKLQKYFASLQNWQMKILTNARSCTLEDTMMPIKVFQSLTIL